MDEKRLMEKYDKLNRRIRRYFSGYFKGPHLTNVQALVLEFIILESPKRDIFPKDLEEFLEIKPSSVTSLINNLERNGYLYRVSQREDGRYKKLVLTQKTIDIQQEIVIQIESYVKSIFEGIAEDDLQVFENVIVQMTKNIDLEI